MVSLVNYRHWMSALEQAKEALRGFEPASMSLLSSPNQHKDLEIADIATLAGLSDQEATRRLQREGGQ